MTVAIANYSPTKVEVVVLTLLGNVHVPEPDPWAGLVAACTIDGLLDPLWGLDP